MKTDPDRLSITFDSVAELEAVFTCLMNKIGVQVAVAEPSNDLLSAIFTLLQEEDSSDV
jgi:hypothetical protein